MLKSLDKRTISSAKAKYCLVPLNIEPPGLIVMFLITFSKPILKSIVDNESPCLMLEKVQSHLYTRRGNRRLSLAALPGLPTASRGAKLPLLANTRSVF